MNTAVINRNPVLYNTLFAGPRNDIVSHLMAGLMPANWSRTFVGSRNTIVIRTPEDAAIASRQSEGTSSHLSL